MGSTDPIRPTMVKTLTVKPGSAIQTASLAPIAVEPARGNAREPERVSATTAVAPPPERPVEALPSPRPGILGVLKMRSANAAEMETRPSVSAAPARESQSRATATHRSGWMIQVGAFPDESEARQTLSSAKSTASRLLGSAEPFTETVQKGDKTLYRARFAGLEKDQAESACKALKRSDIACMTIKN
jgi:D-alanyl-D-alanine carboxypeptidase